MGGNPMSITTRPVAHVLREAWELVLGEPPTSGDDNFFVAGGHSFSSVRLMSIVEDELDIEFPLESLLHGTLAEVVEECELRVAEHRDDPNVSSLIGTVQQPSGMA